MPTNSKFFYNPLQLHVISCYIMLYHVISCYIPPSSTHVLIANCFTRPQLLPYFINQQLAILPGQARTSLDDDRTTSRRVTSPLLFAGRRCSALRSCASPHVLKTEGLSKSTRKYMIDITLYILMLILIYIYICIYIYNDYIMCTVSTRWKFHAKWRGHEAHD